MINYLKNSTRTTKLKIIVLFSMFVALVWAVCSESVEMYEITTNKNLFSENFTQIIDGEEFELNSIDDFIDVGKGEELVLVSVIPEITSDKSLVFHTKDIEVRVYVDDDLIYDFVMLEQFEFLKTPGQNWNSVEITQDMIGKEIRLEFISNFDNRYDVTLGKLYLVNKSEVLGVMQTC